MSIPTVKMDPEQLARLIHEVASEQVARLVDERLAQLGLMKQAPAGPQSFRDADRAVQAAIVCHLDACDDVTNRFPAARSELERFNVVMRPADLRPDTLARTLTAMRRERRFGSVYGLHVPEAEWRPLVEAQ